MPVSRPPGRPTVKARTVRVTVRVTPDAAAWLDAQRTAKNCSRVDVICALIDERRLSPPR